MAIELKRSVGSESSITSIVSESIREGSLNEICETTADVSSVPLKVRKPYTISKQREKWTEEEHQRFIEALKIYGRAWRHIEEFIGTKTAVQIRSHAQKFFSKVMKEGVCSAEASTEPIAIPPPRPKRKPLHPYPRKLMDNPIETKQSLTLVENGTYGDMKTFDKEAHSPISVLSPVSSQIATSLDKAQGHGCGSRTSSDTDRSNVVEKNILIKDDSTQEMAKENEDLSLTLHFSGSSPDDTTLMSAGNTLKDIRNTTNEYDYLDNRMIKCVGTVAAMKSIKLFGHTVSVLEQSEYPDGMVNSKSLSCTGSTSDSFNKVKNGEANLESVDSKSESNHQPNANNSNKLKNGFYQYKRCFSDCEAPLYIHDDRESQRIRVYL